MGFSVAVAAAILLAGFLFFASVMAESFLNAQSRVQESLRDAREILSESREGEIRIANVTFQLSGTEAWINVTNNGSITYNVSNLDVLLNGIVRTTNVTQKTVNDVATNVWPPATRLEIRASTPVAPAAVTVVAPTGDKAFWRA